MVRRRREVRTREERSTVGCEEDRHRPSATAGHGLGRGHVVRVHIGTLFAVDLDGDEVLVQHGGGVEILETLVRHHVAPVTGRVPDGEKDRPILPLSSRERVVTPRDHQSTGLSACWRRYALDELASRLVTDQA